MKAPIKIKYLCLLGILLFVCFYAKGSNVSDTSKIVSYYDLFSSLGSNTIKIKGDSNFYPFEFINQQGKPDGLNIDIIKAVMKRLGLKYTIELDNWDTVINQLKSNDIDIVTGLVISNSRKNYASFSVPHNIIYRGFISKVGSGCNDISDLIGKRIALKWEQIENDDFNKFVKYNNIVSYKDLNDAIDLLLNDELDAVICTSIPGTALINNRGIKGLEVHNFERHPLEYCMAVNKDNDALLYFINMGLLQLKMDGEYTQIYNKWMGVYENKKISRTTLFVVGALFLFLVIATLFILVLRARIRKAINKLDINEKKFKEILNSTSDAIITEDMNGNFIDCNDTAVKMLGFKNRTEFVNSDHNSLMAPTQQLREAQYEYLNTHESYTYERIAKKITGESFWVEVSLRKTMLFDKSAIISVVRDISERKNAQKELNQTRKELELAISAGDLVVWSYDVKKDLFSTIQGNWSDYTGVSFKDSFSHILSDDIPTYKRSFEEMISSKINDFEYVFRVLKGDGKIVSLEAKMISVRNDDGDVIRIVGLYKDVTEQMRIRKELLDFKVRTDFMLKSSGMLQWLYDTRTKTFLSRDQLAIQPNIPINAIDYLGYIHSDDVSIYKDFINSMDNKKEQQLTVEYRFKLPREKSYYWEVAEAEPFERDNNGEIIIYTGLVRNNTKWRAMAENLVRLMKKAEEASRLKSAFLANMSHEIRTPLNAIVGFSSLLSSTQSEEERSMCIEKIQTNNQNLLNLMNDIFDISRLESETMMLSRAQVSLNAICDEVYCCCKSKCKCGVEIRKKFLEEDIIITTDSLRLKQILCKFICNSIKYTNEGYIEIGINKLGDVFELYVQDTGIGIEEEKKQKLFESFTQINDFEQGLGLGLAISKKLTELLGGEIGYESKIGVGSRFFVKFPIS